MKIEPSRKGYSCHLCRRPVGFRKITADNIPVPTLTCNDCLELLLEGAIQACKDALLRHCGCSVQIRKVKGWVQMRDEARQAASEGS